MQVRIFTIPILGGEMLTDEMNVFLRSKKILQVKELLVNHDAEGAFWCFCIKYVDDVAAAEREKGKVDYRTILDEAAFKRFSALRETRKRVAKELACTLKPESLNRTTTGLPFLGYHVFPYHVRLLQKSKQRFIRKMRSIDDHYQTEEWPESKCQRKVLPLLAFTKHADADQFRKNVLSKI